MVVTPAFAAYPQTYLFDQKWSFPSPYPSTSFQPHGMVTYAGHQFVAAYDNYIAEYENGALVRTFPLAGVATASEVAVGENVMWVIDNDTGQVRKFDASGTYLDVTITGFGIGFNLPYAVSIDSFGCVYVADMGGLGYGGRITKYAADGTYVCTLGSSATAGLWKPVSIAIGPNQHVYVADGEAGKIREYTPSNAGRTSYSASVTFSAALEEPDSLSIDAAGNIFALDGSYQTLTKYSPDRSVLSKWGQFGTGAGQFTHPWSVTVDPATHQVYVDDRDAYNLQRFHLQDVRPLTYAYGTVTVKKGSYASFKYKVTGEISPGVSAKVKIYSGTRLKATISCGSVAQGFWHTKKWKCNLARGTYTWKVYATDSAGHTQRSVSYKTLKVK